MFLYHLYYYVPHKYLEVTKNAIFAAGAGTIGKYSCCSWETKGNGQFYPEAGSNPFIGKKCKITKVAEYKVETVCPEHKLKKVVAALKAAHPYETPAYGFFKINSSQKNSVRK